MRWGVARKPSTIEGLACALFSERGIESGKASIRSKVGHPLLIVKRRLRRSRTRYGGIEENPCMLDVCFALANLAMCISAGRLLSPAPSFA